MFTKAITTLAGAAVLAALAIPAAAQSVPGGQFLPEWPLCEAWERIYLETQGACTCQIIDGEESTICREDGDDGTPAMPVFDPDSGMFVIE